jgi:hypothetical protein
MLLFAGGIALIIAAEAKTKARRRAVLDAVARRMGVERRPDAGVTQVAGRVDGREVTFHLTYHGSGKSRRAFTEVDVALPPTTFHLELRGQTMYEESRVRRGLAVDVQIGDRIFDDSFIVEAAPADVARELLTVDLRRALMHVKPWKVLPAGLGLRIEKYGHVLEVDEAVALVDLAARLAAGVRPAEAAAEAKLEAAAPMIGGPFRAEADAGGIRAQKAARAEEVVALVAMKERRARRERIIGFTILAGAVIVFILMAAVK